MPGAGTFKRLSPPADIDGMSTITAIAQSGLQAAQLRLSSSAHNIANLHTPGFTGQQVRQQAQPALGGVQARLAPAGQAGVALESEAVEQMAATYAFKANAVVLRVSADTTGALLDVHS